VFSPPTCANMKSYYWSKYSETLSTFIESHKSIERTWSHILNKIMYKIKLVWKLTLSSIKKKTTIRWKNKIRCSKGNKIGWIGIGLVSEVQPWHEFRHWGTILGPFWRCFWKQNRGKIWQIVTWFLNKGAIQYCVRA